MINLKEMAYEKLEPEIEKIFDQQNEDTFDQVPERNAEKIVIGAYNGKDLVGGIIGNKQYQNIHVAMLAVKDDYRGQSVGSMLLEEIEKRSREMDIIHITLSTKSYQAEGFYKKHGYEVFGTLEDMPIKGVTKFYFHKRLN
ncbi:GNAT family N-acetyltransferase [Marinilactibacillus sp. Marseille-P9653]|uniref:GNAT family N-acetyltransferase n=1 Tax=Marinilactibacillus sp. Marseille-P9653 TaxID=2866583 RepID=UPI001CE3BDEF|nr:GNAT family N-acetyltransferase [Marinilactibacillus sp. Marseille-P9653]